jgi:AcrR family transcriptional regulator
MEATISLLVTEGFSNLTMESVAAAAGVGKSTIYRRYPGKLEMVIDAMTRHVMLDDLPDTGSLRSDLLSFHTHGGHNLSMQLLSGAGSTIIGTVLAEKERNPELIETFRRLITDRRREQYRTVVRRAIKRGEIDSAVDSDDVTTALFGSLVGRAVAGIEISDEVIERSVDLLLNGLLKR